VTRQTKELIMETTTTTLEPRISNPAVALPGGNRLNVATRQVAGQEW
jgi:hypothetical protein